MPHRGPMPVSADLDHLSEVVSIETQPGPNSVAQLQFRVANRRLSWSGPLIVLPSRIAFMLLAQGVFALVFVLRSVTNPWFAAAPWWTVYGTLIDIGGLALLWHYTRREGIGVRDLVGPIYFRYGRDLFLGVGLFLLIFPFFVAGGAFGCKLIYGAYQSHAFPGILAGRVLPFWAVIYSRFVWWVIWSTTEEMTYAGYLLPRIQALSKRRWIAVALVGFVWAIQHSFIPFLPEWRNFIWRFIAFVPGVVVMSFIYLRIRRLGPLIVAHWMMDIIAMLMTMA